MKNYLMAKTKGKKGQFLTIVSDKTIFFIPTKTDSAKEYTPEYKLEDDELFVINEFSTKDFCIDFLKNNFVPTIFKDANKDDFDTLEYFCSYQDDLYYFQKIRKSNFIKGKYLSLSNLKLVENEPLVVINDIPQAIYDKKKDALYFKNLATISSIFKGIDELYREATNEETSNFLSQEFIQLDNEYYTQKVGKANRKRLALAIDTLKGFGKKDKKKIFKYVHEYCPSLNFDENDSTFTIASENDLKDLIWGIEQRFYTTKIGKEKRLANSIETRK